MSLECRGVLRPLSIAPMMDRTDRHYRYFMRLITQSTLLYTEMVTTKAIIHGNRDLILGYEESDHPVALQLGGDDPKELAYCASLAEDLGFDEVNLNVGCPSSRVQSGNFGACLMLQPERVAEGVSEMRAACSLPVTVKHRIGVDEIDQYEHLANFVSIVSESGADRFSVHARKAWLNGLSPKENRTIPPLRYADVYQLKSDFPDLDIEINGGIKSHPEIVHHLKSVDAVMIGRAAYDNPWLFHDADSRYFNAKASETSRIEVAYQMVEYIERCLEKGTRMMSISRHMLQLFAGVPGARRWRQVLGTASARRQANIPMVLQYLLDYQEKAQQSLEVS